MSTATRDADDSPFDPLIFWVSASFPMLFPLLALLYGTLRGLREYRAAHNAQPYKFLDKFSTIW